MNIIKDINRIICLNMTRCADIIYILMVRSPNDYMDLSSSDILGKHVW